MKLRTYRLDEARDRVLHHAKFRLPQREAFDVFHNILSRLDDDIPRLPQGRLVQQAKESGLVVPHPPPDLTFELATGVGKTRLMGGLVAYLFLSGQTKNCVVLASRVAILDKLEREVQTGSDKYLFLDAALIPDPNVCYRTSLESFVPDGGRLNVFLLSPQTITGTDRRFHRRSDFGPSLGEYLLGLNDLIVLTDEAHHLPGAGDREAAAWREALRALEPRLHFGFTATPVEESACNIVYKYPLAQCLRDGLYTKAVKMWVEPQPEAISDDDWDKVILDFGIQRLAHKRNAIAQLRSGGPALPGMDFPLIEPVMLVNARDKEHAEQIASWLVDERGFETDEVLLTHTGKKLAESEIKRLVRIDEPENRIKIVVNIYQLTEGWDVTNVYVVAPLRAMATFQNAIQSMGRGLRLPAGTRVGDPELDTLDVLCFGKESFEQILNHALQEFGASPTIEVEKAEEAEESPATTRMVTIKALLDISFELPKVTRIPQDPDLEFNVDKTTGLHGFVAGIDLSTLERVGSDADDLQYTFDAVVSLATQRIIAQLSYLSDPVHTGEVRSIIETLLSDLGAKPDSVVAVDPVKVALLVAGEIDRRYIESDARYQMQESSESIRPKDFEWPLPVRYKSPVSRGSLKGWE